MAFFSNILIAAILVGIITRFSHYLFFRYLKDRKIALYTSFIVCFVVIELLITIFVGFDVAISSYLIAFIIWLIFDFIKYSKEISK